MSTITANEINKLRKATGAGMMDCRKALTEANGDFEQAIDWLRKQGQKIASKRSDREANEGVVLVAKNEGVGYIMCLSCETDFVAKNADFIKFAQQILNVAVQHKATAIQDILVLKLNDHTVADLINEKLATIGEKIEISKYETLGGEFLTSYIHGANRIGVLVALNQDHEEVGKNIAMQIAAMNPVALDASQVSTSIIERERAVIIEQLKLDPKMEGKPDDMLAKISEGKLSAFFKEQTLVAQPYVKNQSQSVQDYLSTVQNNLKILGFKRVSVGQ
ncbi:MAG: translation elongation factor Ts [Alphaproteobacteria bacterium]|nr:translation elongation factor Ts [Alphaproteobacteria bacterium]